MSEEPIYCFNDTPEKRSECIYAGCDYFQNQLDNCGFKLFLNLIPKLSLSGSPKRPEKVQQALDAKRSFINTLNAGDSKITIHGKLKYDPIQKDIDTSRGPQTVTNILIDDGTGELRIAFWGEQANIPMNFVANDDVIVDDIYKIKEPYDGILQANAGKHVKMRKQ